MQEKWSAAAEAEAGQGAVATGVPGQAQTPVEPVEPIEQDVVAETPEMASAQKNMRGKSIQGEQEEQAEQEEQEEQVQEEEEEEEQQQQQQQQSMEPVVAALDGLREKAVPLLKLAFRADGMAENAATLALKIEAAIYAAADCSSPACNDAYRTRVKGPPVATRCLLQL